MISAKGTSEVIGILAKTRTDRTFPDDFVFREVSYNTQNWTVEQLRRRREHLEQVVHALAEVEHHRDSSSASHEYNYPAFSSY